MKEYIRQWALNLSPPLVTKLLRKFINMKQYSSESDEYIRWICRIVGGWLTPYDGNHKAFEYALRNIPSGGAIVEIGSFLGLSTNIIAYLLEKYQRDNIFFSCDPWRFEGVDKPIGGYFDASKEDYRNYCKEVFIMNLELFSKKRKPYAIETYSEKFFDLWRTRFTTKDVFGRTIKLGGSIGFAYIDGAHTYDAVKTDFNGVDQFLLPGGFVLIDDSSLLTRFGGITKLAREVKHNPSYELLFKTPNYFFRKKKSI